MNGDSMTQLQSPVSTIKNTTLRQKLQSEKEMLELRLKEVNSVLEALKNNPEVADVLDAVSKLYPHY